MAQKSFHFGSFVDSGVSFVLCVICFNFQVITYENFQVAKDFEHGSGAL